MTNEALDRTNDVPAEWYEDMRKHWELEKARADAFANVLRAIACGRMPEDYGKDSITAARLSGLARDILDAYS